MIAASDDTPLWTTATTSPNTAGVNRPTKTTAGSSGKLLNMCKQPQQYQTTADEDGGGHIKYLDRHDVKCPNQNQALTGFRMNRAFNSRIYFTFSCMDVGADGSKPTSTEMKTNREYLDYGQPIFLDRHDVKCPGNSVMKRWHLDREGTKWDFSIHYTCVDLGYDSDVKNHSTGYTENGGDKEAKKVVLHLHGLNCDDGYALKGFRLSRGGNNQIRFDYSCQKIQFTLN